MSSVVGLIGKKLGMTHVFDQEGNSVPVTVVQAGPCPVVQVKTPESDGYSALQVGFESIPTHKLNKPLQGHFKKSGLKDTTRHLSEFRLTEAASHEVGSELTVEQFEVGSMVTVQGEAIGKGFMGTVKRHGFSRGPMSHGSKSHRIPGSIGAGTTPGRVYKGKKMAGRKPNKTTTIKNLAVVDVNQEQNIILIKGSTPGANGAILKITPTRKVGS